MRKEEALNALNDLFWFESGIHWLRRPREKLNLSFTPTFMLGIRSHRASAPNHLNGFRDLTANRFH